MPRYDFRCNKCGHKFTVDVSIEEKDNVKCPKCESAEVKQLISGCAVHTGNSGCVEPSSGGG